MTHQQFKDWLDQLVYVWTNKQPKKAPDLCADNFFWHETPFGAPYTTKRDLLKSWQSVKSQKNISVSYKILCVEGNIGIANWAATFIILHSGEKKVMDGIYQVSLDEKGKCIEFHQWFNFKNTSSCRAES